MHPNTVPIAGINLSPSSITKDEAVIKDPTNNPFIISKITNLVGVI